MLVKWKVKGFTWETELRTLSGASLSKAAARHAYAPSFEIDADMRHGDVFERGQRVGTFEVIG